MDISEEVQENAQEDESENPCLFDLLDPDSLSSLLCACRVSALGRLACTCKAVRAAVFAAEPWRAAILRDFGVPPQSCVDLSDSRRLYKGLKAASSHPGQLLVEGFFTDGGLDQLHTHAVGDELDPSRLPPSFAPGAVVTRVAPDEARQFWVSGCFGAPEDYRTFCSDVHPGTNIVIAGRVAGVGVGGGGAGEEAARQAKMERRQFVVERLAPVAHELWGWDEEGYNGFGGLAYTSTDNLEHALLAAWAMPQARALLVADLPLTRRARAWRRLVEIVAEIREPQALTLTSVGGPGGRLLLVDHDSLKRAREWRVAQRAGGSSASHSRETYAADADAVLFRGGAEVAEAAAAAADDGDEAEEAEGEEEEEEEGGGWPTDLPPSAHLDARSVGSMLLAPPGQLCVVSALHVRRGVHCSCPASCGWVLGCRGPLRPETLYSPRMAALDDVVCVEQLPRSRAAAERSGSLLPCVAHVHRLEEATLVELERDDEELYGDGPFPIAWFAFHMTLETAGARKAAHPAWRESGDLQCALKQRRCTGMLLAKLVAAENRMQAMSDDHVRPNIDLEYVGGSGFSVAGPLNGLAYPEAGSEPPATTSTSLLGRLLGRDGGE